MSSDSVILCVILTKCDSGELSQIQELITERMTV